MVATMLSYGAMDTGSCMIGTAGAYRLGKFIV
jgi:hypothetical protein